MCREKLNFIILAKIKNKEVKHELTISGVLIDMETLFCNLWGKLKEAQFPEDIQEEQFKLKILFFMMMGLFDKEGNVASEIVKLKKHSKTKVVPFSDETN